MANLSWVVAVNWGDAKRRVLKSYREWIRAVCLLFCARMLRGRISVA